MDISTRPGPDLDSDEGDVDLRVPDYAVPEADAVPSGFDDDLDEDSLEVRVLPDLDDDVLELRSSASGGEDEEDSLTVRHLDEEDDDTLRVPLVDDDEPGLRVTPHPDEDDDDDNDDDDGAGPAHVPTHIPRVARDVPWAAATGQPLIVREFIAAPARSGRRVATLGLIVLLLVALAALKLFVLR